jgi:hypothetical protein
VIKTYSNDPAPPPPPAQGAQQEPEEPAQPGKPKRKKASRPKPKPSPAVDADLAPKVTAPTIFGDKGPAAFRGYAFVLPPDTTKLPNLAQMVPFGTVYTNQFQIAKQDFAGGFPGALQQEEWFAIRYEGFFMVENDGEQELKLVSDDGAILWVDNRKVIDNDGVHTEKAATGKIDLKRGRHLLRLDYFQAKKGSVALQVFRVEGGQDKPLVGVR